VTDEPRIGIYVCHCGLNIADSLDPKAVAEAASVLPGVIVSRDDRYCCVESGQKQIREDIEAFRLNRVVVAACSPKLHEATFRRALVEAGLNPYLFEMANIREQCSWVHLRHREVATRKALDLVKMAVFKVRWAEPLPPRRVHVVRRALVVGGGIAGIQSALDMANAGHRVYLVEKGPTLGGLTARFGRVFPHMDSPLRLLGPKIMEVGLHPRIEVLVQTQIESVQGYIGNFHVTLVQEPRYVSAHCDLCGLCTETCPVEVPNEYDGRLSYRKAIFFPFPYAFPPVFALDSLHCNRCGLCQDICPQKAINLEEKAQRLEVDVGGIVVATGFEPFDPARRPHLGYGEIPGVVSSVEVERMLAPSGPTGGVVLRPSDRRGLEKIGFLLCVGCMEEGGENPYCSKICCMVALKQASMILEQTPSTRVIVFHGDIRTPGKYQENLYQRVRELGAVFSLGDVEEISDDGRGGVRIRAYNRELDAMVEENLDLLVLSVGAAPGVDNKNLRDLLKNPLGPDGFFLEAHPKLRPLETVIDGVFLAGACQAPKRIGETLVQASGAAAKMDGILGRDWLELDAMMAEVDPEKCIGCMRCVEICPFSAMEALELEGQRMARVVEAACKGCGICAGECPTGAVDVMGFTEAAIHAQIDAALEENANEKIIAFTCNWCSYAGADFAGVSRLQYPGNVRIIRLMCSGRLTDAMVLHGFEKGAAMVLVSGCHPPNDCHYISGNLLCEKRVERLKKTLPRKGIDPGRLRLCWISATEGVVFQQAVCEMAELVAQQRGNRTG